MRIFFIFRLFPVAFLLLICAVFARAQGKPMYSANEDSLGTSQTLTQNKLWPKATLQQALRQIRGFRPQSLSTARGFGKRFDSQAINWATLRSAPTNQDMKELTPLDILRNEQLQLIRLLIANRRAVEDGITKNNEEESLGTNYFPLLN